MAYRLKIAICCLMFSFSAQSQTVLVDFSSNWSYYDNENEPADNGGFDWNDINYDDSTWSQGNAELGYGDGDENTVINDSTLTAYFRQSFTVADPLLFDSLDIDLIYDDGAVIYMNGTEIWRVNMPTGVVDYNTLASSNSGDNAREILSLSNNLVAGENVLAIEIHQSSSTSSDISFDVKAVTRVPIKR